MAAPSASGRQIACALRNDPNAFALTVAKTCDVNVYAVLHPPKPEADEKENETDEAQSFAQAASGYLFLYELVDPNTDRVFYVGQANDPALRMAGHDSTDSGCKLVRDRLLALGKSAHDVMRIVPELPHGVPAYRAHEFEGVLIDMRQTLCTSHTEQSRQGCNQNNAPHFAALVRDDWALYKKVRAEIEEGTVPPPPPEPTSPPPPSSESPPPSEPEPSPAQADDTEDVEQLLRQKEGEELRALELRQGQTSEHSATSEALNTVSREGRAFSQLAQLLELEEHIACRSKGHEKKATTQAKAALGTHVVDRAAFASELNEIRAMARAVHLDGLPACHVEGAAVSDEAVQAALERGLEGVTKEINHTVKAYCDEGGHNLALNEEACVATLKALWHLVGAWIEGMLDLDSPLLQECLAFRERAFARCATLKVVRRNSALVKDRWVEKWKSTYQRQNEFTVRVLLRHVPRSDHIIADSDLSDEAVHRYLLEQLIGGHGLRRELVEAPGQELNAFDRGDGDLYQLHVQAWTRLDAFANRGEHRELAGILWKSRDVGRLTTARVHIYLDWHALARAEQRRRQARKQSAELAAAATYRKVQAEHAKEMAQQAKAEARKLKAAARSEQKQAREAEKAATREAERVARSEQKQAREAEKVATREAERVARSEARAQSAVDAKAQRERQRAEQELYLKNYVETAYQRCSCRDPLRDNCPDRTEIDVDLRPDRLRSFSNHSCGHYIDMKEFGTALLTHPAPPAVSQDVVTRLHRLSVCTLAKRVTGLQCCLPLASTARPGVSMVCLRTPVCPTTNERAICGIVRRVDTLRKVQEHELGQPMERERDEVEAEVHKHKGESGLEVLTHEGQATVDSDDCAEEGVVGDKRKRFVKDY